MRKVAVALLFLLLVAPSTRAQRSSYQQMMDFNRIVTSRINADMTAKTMTPAPRGTPRTIQGCDRIAAIHAIVEWRRNPEVRR